MTHHDSKLNSRGHRPAVGITRWLLLGLMLALPGAAEVRATDPTPPLEIRDPRSGFVIGLVPSGLQASAVTARLVFNRYAGRVIGSNELMIGQYPVSRLLTVKDNRDGTFSVDASPIAKGQPKLPDGVYSQILVLDHAAAVGYQRPVRHLHPIYFQVVSGVPSRIRMPVYSLRVEPESSGKSRDGQTVMLGKGVVSSGVAVPSAGGNALDERLENGNLFAAHGNEGGEN